MNQFSFVDYWAHFISFIFYFCNSQNNYLSVKFIKSAIFHFLFLRSFFLIFQVNIGWSNISGKWGNPRPSLHVIYLTFLVLFIHLIGWRLEWMDSCKYRRFFQSNQYVVWHNNWSLYLRILPSYVSRAKVWISMGWWNFSKETN